MFKLLLLLFPFYLGAQVPTKNVYRKIILDPTVCSVYNESDKNCVPVDLNFNNIKDVIIDNKGNTCNSYKINASVSSVNPQGQCVVHPSGSVFHAITSIDENEYELDFTDTEGNTQSVELPGIAVEEEGNILTAPGESTLGVHNLNFVGNSVTATRTSNKVTISITPITDPDSQVIALNSVPTDLSGYFHGQILFVNTATPGGVNLYEVTGADSTERHLFKIEGTTDPNNSVNWGFSLIGDVYGKLKTWDGGKEFIASDSPVLRMELEDDSDDDLILLVPKSVITYANAENTLYVRFYQGEIGTPNYVLENGIRVDKLADNPSHNYTSYGVHSGDEGDVTRLIGDRQYITGFGLFTSLPAQDDQTTNAFNLHSAKAIKQFYTARAKSVSTPPSNPQKGDRIEMLADATIPGGAVLNSAVKTGTGAGTYTGYDSTTTPSLGGIEIQNSNFIGLASYKSTSGTASFRNRTVFRSSQTFIPTVVTINGTDYSVTADATLTSYFLLASPANGNTLQDGEKYYVNARNATLKLYPDVTLRAGHIYIWTGIRWIEESANIDQVDERIENWAQKDNTDQIPISKLCGNTIYTPSTLPNNRTRGFLYCVKTN